MQGLVVLVHSGFYTRWPRLRSLDHGTHALGIERLTALVEVADARISAEQLAGVSRMALRAYDACQAGDEQDAKALFKRLDRIRF